MAKVIIILLLLIFFVFYPLVLYWANHMEDIWQLKLIMGKMGVGKSGLIAKMSMQDLKDPRIKRVYTSTGVPGTYKFDPEDLKNGVTFPPNSSVYIDEFGLVANSRDFKTFPAELRKWFKYARQSRLKLTLFSQSTDVDKSVRDLCHSYSLLRRVGPFVIEFPVNKNLDVGADMEGNGQLIDNYFKSGLLGVHIHYLPRYFDLWESFDPPAWDYINSEFIKITPAFIRSNVYRKFYKFNFKIVYSSLLARVSSLKRRIYNRLFYRTTFLLPIDFVKIQMFEIR